MDPNDDSHLWDRETWLNFYETLMCVCIGFFGVMGLIAYFLTKFDPVLK